MEHFRLPGLEDLNAGTLYCIGRNYAEHARELENEVPDRPLVFLKPRSSIVYEGSPIRLPTESSDVHHEVELVAAIGKTCRRVSAGNALEAVAGYAVGIDVTARDIQQAAKEKGHPWSTAKGFDTFAPLGNFLPAREVPDPQQLHLELSVNGRERQSDPTSLMLFPVARLIAYLSGIFTLWPGDLLFTGTPKGVSPLADGDRLAAGLKGKEMEMERESRLAIDVRGPGGGPGT